MNNCYLLLQGLTERYPPSEGSGGHRVYFTEEGQLTIGLFIQRQVFTYVLDKVDLHRSVPALLDELFQLQDAKNTPDTPKE